MDRKYNLNELAMMTGLTTRTLRNYLAQGLLHGRKTDGVWEFSLEEIDKFFSEPFVKESLRIKRTSVVYDFLADRKKKEAASCVILDIPCTVKKGNEISSFFCEKVNDASGISFNYEWSGGHARVILSGSDATVKEILTAYGEL